MLPWNQIGQLTAEQASYSTHFFTFWVQVQATVASSGKHIVLDVEAPKPMPMNCLGGRPCWAMYELNVPAGASAYKKCLAIPGRARFQPSLNFHGAPSI